MPADLRGNTVGSYATIEGAIALHEKRFDDAIAAFRKRAATGVCSYCGDTDLALAFEQAAMPDSAIARYEHYLSTPSLDRIWVDGATLASVYERLADLYMSKGDRQNAARYAAKFVELWQNADSELQPRVHAKRRMLQEIQARN